MLPPICRWRMTYRSEAILLRSHEQWDATQRSAQQVDDQEAEVEAPADVGAAADAAAAIASWSAKDDGSPFCVQICPSARRHAQMARCIIIFIGATAESFRYANTAAIDDRG